MEHILRPPFPGAVLQPSSKAGVCWDRAGKGSGTGLEIVPELGWEAHQDQAGKRACFGVGSMPGLGWEACWHWARKCTGTRLGMGWGAHWDWAGNGLGSTLGRGWKLTRTGLGGVLALDWEAYWE